MQPDSSKTFQGKLPVAVVTAHMPTAIHYLRERYEVEQINFASNRITTRSGLVFYLVTKREQLLGMEIQGIIDAPWARDNKEYHEIHEFAMTRIRREP